MARRYYHKTHSYDWLWWLLLAALVVYGGWRLYNHWFVFNPRVILENATLKEKSFDTEVKEITSPKAKIKAYLFQDKTNPIISISFLFKNAGLSTDEGEESGISTMVAALLTEGAGNLDSQAFKELLEQKAIGMGFSVDMDDFSGHLLTTRENMDTAFKLLNMALTKPRFDAEDVQRTKAQMLTALKRQVEHPSGILALAAAKEIFGEHVHCFFAEPTHAPCMTLGLATGLHDAVCVKDIGLDGLTAADGLAVGRPSSLVGRLMETRLDGCFTVEDDELYRLLALLACTEEIPVEPSGCAGFPGVRGVLEQQAYLEKRGLAPLMHQACHIVWATGGSMVPPEEMASYRQRGEDLL